MARPPVVLVVLFVLSSLALSACGATAGPGAGEVMLFGSGDDTEEDAGADAGRQPLPLDGGP